MPPSTLERPLTLRSGLRLENRVVKASTSESLAVRGDPGEELFRVYETWSRGGPGLILLGNSTVSRRHRERMRNVVLDEQTDRAALARLASAAKTAGNPALVQLCHPGRQTGRHVASDPVAPSAGPAVALLGAFARPRALNEEEIEEILGAFVRAALLVREAGFDGVQLHAAHGYLLSQFLSPRTNQREDAWGGTLANRARFLLEAIARTRRATGDDFTIAVKLNSSDFQRGGFEAEDSLEVVGLLEDAPIDLLEISGGNYESAALLGLDDHGRPSTVAREGYFLEFARAARSRTKHPLMLTGGMRSRAAMIAAIDQGAIDLVGMARPLCVEPDLPGRLVRGEADGARLDDRRKAPIGVLAAAGETGYFARRIADLAHGREPTIDESPTRAALWYVASDVQLGIARALGSERPS